MLGIEHALAELLVVFRNLAHLRLLEEVVAGIHLDAERVEGADDLLDVGDDGLLLIGHFGEVVAVDGGIEGELDLLGVDKHELEFGGMLAVEQRSEHRIETYRLTGTGGTGHEEVGHLGEVGDEDLVGDGLAEGDGELHLGILVGGTLEHGFHADNLRLGIGHLDTDVALAGDGCDDADAEGSQGEGDVVLEALDFADADARSGLDLVEGHRGSRGGGDVGNLDAVVPEGLDNAVLVGDEFLFGNIGVGDLPVFKEVGFGHDVVGEVEMGVVGFVEPVVAAVVVGVELVDVGLVGSV